MMPRVDDLPMFWGDAHRALCDELGAGIARQESELHEPHRAAQAMARMGLYALLVPPALGGRTMSLGRDQAIDVRALCVAREALAYASPLSDSIFAVQGLGS